MKLLSKLLFVLFFFTKCINIPALPELKPLKSSSKQTLEELKKEYKIESIEYYYTREVSKNKDDLEFTISLYDLDKEPRNYDSINHTLVKAFNDSGYKLNKCSKIGIFYIRSNEETKLWKMYVLDGNERVIKTSYI